MQKSLALTSVALNVALICALAWNWQRDATGIAQVQTDLRSAGLDELQAWKAVGILLQSAATGEAEYWKPNFVSSNARELASYEELLKARDALRASIGEGAVHDPRFAPLFQPYQTDLGFLPPAQQMELQSIMMKQLRQPGAPEGVDAQIKSLLSAEHWKEYQYRKSPLRQRLLASGFDFSEQEYRAVFDLVAAASVERNLAFSAGAIGDPAANPELSQALRDALGEERFARFRKVQDPNYATLLHVARSHDLPTSSIDGAYALIMENNADRQRVGRSLGADPARSERESQLREILGPQAFEEFSKLSPSYGPNQMAAFIGR